MSIYIQKEPGQVEAIQFTGLNFNECEEFAEGIIFHIVRTPGGERYGIIDNKRVNPTDYIERFEYEGEMEYTVSDKEDFEQYYKLLK